MKHTFFIITMIGLSIFLSCNKDTSVIADKSKEDILKLSFNHSDGEVKLKTDMLIQQLVVMDQRLSYLEETLNRLIKVLGKNI